MNVQLRDGHGRLRSPEGALPSRERVLIPAPAVINRHVGPTAYQRGFAMGRKSVDRWAPAFAGLIVGAIIGAGIVLAGVTVLS